MTLSTFEDFHDQDEPPIVQLGYVVKKSKNRFSEFQVQEEFPSKIGGRPLWLNPEKVLPLSSTKCNHCQDPMVLLLQLYTAEDFPEEAYHRYLYLWICPKGACHQESERQSNSLRLFRSQLPLRNAYYEMQGDQCVRNVLPARAAARLCEVCGVAGTHTCTRCRSAFYCSATHQRVHWHREHARTCGKSGGDTPYRGVYSPLYPEYLLETAAEPDPTDVQVPATEPADGTLVVSRAGGSAVITHDEAYEHSNTGVDNAFLKFQKRLARAPDQVLRYLRTGPVPAPALAILDHLPPPAPPCPRCAGPRTLEVQVLSTLLYYLDLPDLPDSLDFGALFLYTCDANCVLDDAYAQEVVCVQSFSADSMRPQEQGV